MLQRLEKRTKQVKPGKTSTAEPEESCFEYVTNIEYCRNSYEGLKNYYTSLQIAHAINQLLELSREVIEMLKEHSKETIRNIWENLLAYMLMVRYRH